MDARSVYALGGSVLVMGLSTMLFWPRSHEIRLVSPDGSHRLILSATDEGASIVLDGPDSESITITASRDGAAGISLYSRKEGFHHEPYITIHNGRHSRIILSESSATGPPARVPRRSDSPPECRKP